MAGGKPEVGAGGGGEEKEDGCCAIQSKTSTSPLGSGGKKDLEIQDPGQPGHPTSWPRDQLAGPGPRQLVQPAVFFFPGEAGINSVPTA